MSLQGGTEYPPSPDANTDVLHNKLLLGNFQYISGCLVVVWGWAFSYSTLKVGVDPCLNAAANYYHLGIKVALAGKGTHAGR